jgi:hypothetical protein
MEAGLNENCQLVALVPAASERAHEVSGLKARSHRGRRRASMSVHSIDTLRCWKSNTCELAFAFSPSPVQSINALRCCQN